MPTVSKSNPVSIPDFFAPFQSMGFEGRSWPKEGSEEALSLAFFGLSVLNKIPREISDDFKKWVLDVDWNAQKNPKLDLNTTNSEGQTLLHKMAFNMAWGMEVFIQKYAHQLDVNKMDNWGRTPLMQASMFRAGEESITPLLLAGANPNLQDQDGKTALMKCLWVGGSLNSANTLLESPNIQASLKDSKGNTALPLALALRKQSSFNSVQVNELVMRLESKINQENLQNTLPDSTHKTPSPRL